MILRGGNKASSRIITLDIRRADFVDLLGKILRKNWLRVAFSKLKNDPFQ